MASTSLSQSSQIPTLVPAPAGWSYIGCYEDSLERVLDRGFLYRNAGDMTVVSCISYCQSNAFSISGLQWGSECFCGNSIRAGATQKAESECGMACAGDAGQRCGEFWRMNIYQVQSLPAAPSSSRSTKTLLRITSSPPIQAPAQSSSTSTPSSIAITSTSSLEGTSIQFTPLSTDTYSTHSTSSANISTTAVLLPPPIDQVFTPHANSPKSLPSSAAIAGIVVGMTAISAIVVTLLILLVRKWRRNKIGHVTMRQSALFMPIPYTCADGDAQADVPPTYGDSKRNVGRTVVLTTRSSGPMHERKATR
ncbi:hypothetical protein CVT24_005513 [Panaeolus cyanescens]|uniref:WSC domain-containing protein n=1 Tax=Panaeolus cyanescens TaxID=181874 RepID=A0A409YC16_9AGAR|nr:hypothetical protein CVT24_005513 [Panaeolus cyanescens]